MRPAISPYAECSLLLRPGLTGVRRPSTYGTLFGQTVLHAVAPNFRTRPVPSEDGLKSAYKAALALAEARKIEYLGFAFLGAGVFKVRTIRL